jgi:hypothetical protein
VRIDLDLPEVPPSRRRIVGVLIGVIIASLGVFGIVAPGAFVRTVRFFQVPPTVFLAAAIRVAVGIGLVWAAPLSRVSKALLALGVMITAGGLVTPFVGARLGHAILDWWAEGGPELVLACCWIAAAVGASIVFSFTPRRPGT